MPQHTTTMVAEPPPATSTAPRRAAEDGRGRAWGVALLLAAFLAVFYWESAVRLISRWSNEADYSHGFLVPPFALYLLWFRRGMAAAGPGGRWLGVLLLLTSAVIRLGAAYYNYPLADPFSLIPCLAGIALLLGGWPALRWSWPAIAFLIFMIPLPGFLAERLGGPLQRIATISGTYILQTIGVPAAALGNVIHLSEPPPIMVVEACSGLRMLICFMAISVGAAFVVEWGVLERLVIVLSGVPIAIAANVARIASTGFVQEHFGVRVADRLYHDFAGWLMMPLACVLVVLELWILNRLFPAPVSGPVVAGAPTAVPSPAARTREPLVTRSSRKKSKQSRAR